MTRTTRVEPVSEDKEDTFLVLAWRVIDVTDPDAPLEISRHDLEPEAIEAARLYESESSNEPGSDPDDTQDDDASQEGVGKSNE